MRRRYSAFIALLALALMVWHGLNAQERAATQRAQNTQQRARIVPAANAFLESLDENARAKAVIDFASDKRVQWHFIPMETRKGLPLMEMNAEQKQAAMRLLRAVVSQVGYDKATTIMSLEAVLRKLEGAGSEARRNPEKYYFTVFGSPARGQQWGLSVEGHHLSLNFSFQGGRIADSTPEFYGVNPAELKDDYGDKFSKGLRVLDAEETLAFELVNSLNEQQMTKASLPGETPQEIRAAGEAQPPTEPLQGLTVAEMTDDQKATLRKLMEAHTAKMRPAVAEARWEQIEAEGFDKIRFSWSGAKRPGVGHYYVVQGPTFLIEFINVQPDAAGNPANHIHCVWRDMQGDFNLPLAAN